MAGKLADKAIRNADFSRYSPQLIKISLGIGLILVCLFSALFIVCVNLFLRSSRTFTYPKK